MKYPVVEKFKAVQGEGLYAGVPMAFIRLKGCSVGKTICHGCDTDFDKLLPWMGGGEFEPSELRDWIGTYTHICLTGGEPLNHDLGPLLDELKWYNIHIETSGTVELPDWSTPYFSPFICVSPKPGYLPHVVEKANEIKVIVGGLGNGEGWPTLEDALAWSNKGKDVFLQPRNKKNEPDRLTLAHALELVKQYPQLRLSVQLHKFLGER